MSQTGYWMTEIMTKHDRPGFREKAHLLLRGTPDEQVIGALALSVFGEAPTDGKFGYAPGGEDPDGSGLVSHAKRELELAGLFDEGADYNGEVAQAVMAIVRLFAAQGHSGGSAFHVIELLDKLMRFQPLTEIGRTADEWVKVADEHAPGEPNGLWQNSRRSSTFSRDGGKTWYDINDSSLNNGDVWKHYVPVMLGEISVGEDRVRVLDTAYEGVYAERHNGKVGLVVAVRNGLVTVKYDDDDNDIMGHQHEPKNLEKYIGA